MKTLCIEGIASHDNPESCATTRKGWHGALRGAHAGTDIEPRNHIDRGADAVHLGGRQNGMGRYRKHHRGPARSKTRRMREISMRTQSRTSAPSALDRVPQAARRDSKAKFTALFHHITIDRLMCAFHALKRGAAPGVEGIRSKGGRAATPARHRGHWRTRSSNGPASR